MKSKAPDMNDNRSFRPLLLAAALTAGPAFAQPADLLVRVGAFDGGASPTLAVGGSAKAFGVTVTNMGPGDATNVRVTASPPFGAVVSVPSTSTCLAPDPDAGMAGYTCSLATLASGASAQFTWSVRWVAPDEPPATCPTNTGLGASVTATENDPVAGNNSSTLPDVEPPLAFLSATAESPAPASTDGGNPAKRVKPGESIALKGTITNDGPCAVPADSLTIDSSFDNTGSFGLEFEGGSGGCTDWAVSMPHDTADGVCTVATTLASGATIDFTVNQKLLPLATDAGGGSIIQSAAVWNYVVDYAGNPSGAAPVATIIIEGYTNSCAVAGGGLALPLLLLSLLRRSRRK